MNSSRVVLVVWLGPVQGFIQAARRTADLYEGSLLLSALTLEAARSVAQFGELVFPVLGSDGDGPKHNANKIAAVVPLADADTAARAARERVHHAWGARVADVLDLLDRRVPGWRSAIDEARLRLQTRAEDWIEFYAAWSTLAGDDAGAYAHALDEATRIADARKRVRDFAQQEGSPAPKSWQDSGRETVFRGRTAADYRTSIKSLASALHHPTLLRETEHLDGISLVKRLLPLAEHEEAFPSVSHVAARPALDQWWRTRVVAHARGRRYVESVQKAVAGVPEFGEGLRRYQQRFVTGNALREIDPEWLDVERVEQLYVKLWDEADRPAARGRGRELAEAAKALDLRVPSYVAVLAADGDKMATTIKHLATTGGVATHETLSAALAAFAADIERQLETHTDCGAGRGIDGACVYAGGDELLAIVPVARLVPALRAIDGAFDVVREVAPGASISIGVAITHVQTVFEQMRRSARQALDEAKSARAENEGGASPPGHTCIVVSKRSGGDVLVSEATAWLCERLQRFSGYLARGELSSKTAFELRSQLEAVPWVPLGRDESGYETFARTAAAGEIRRLLARRRTREGGRVTEDELAGELFELFGRYASTEREWTEGRWRLAVDLLLIARTLATEAASDDDEERQ